MTTTGLSYISGDKTFLTWPNTRADRYSQGGDVGTLRLGGGGAGEGAACRSVGGRWRDIMWSPNAGHISLILNIRYMK
jgi:hypothetical protein